MAESQDLLQLPETEPSKSQDEFASDQPSRLRLLATRLVHWIYRPPYFPSELTWFLLALIGSTLAVEILPQPSAYWINPSLSIYYTFLGIPLKWGLWSIGIHVGFMLLVGMVLFLLNSKPAFVLWIGLSIYHFVSFTESFRCGAAVYLPFENSTNCLVWQTIVLVFAGILWALSLLVAARLGLIPWMTLGQGASDLASSWRKNLRIASQGWIGFLSGAMILTAFITPRPQWQPIQAAHMPTGRTEASLAYDSQRSVAVLFGGTTSWAQSTGWASVNDTWEWNGNDWIQLHPQHSPSPRLAAEMAFDEKRGVSVLFGGTGQDASHQNMIYGDTWEWDGQDWHEVFPFQNPPPRQAHAMFYDPVRETVVIYGGYNLDPETQASIFLSDAWEWDGKTWQQIAFDQSKRNSSAAMVFDQARQLPILMDAEGLWLWQDRLWAQLNFSISPPGRWNSQLVYDAKHDQVVMFGGFKDKDMFNDTWTYKGQAWQHVITATQPPSRNGHNMFYDQTRRTVLLFGGLNGGTFYNDMWELVQP